ncbi:Cytochrome P450 4d2 [Kappamyces sp. JEL0829]|nr:Cytochrome P450 4d2 [Kappamyces sp. JEL0829]
MKTSVVTGAVAFLAIVYYVLRRPQKKAIPGPLLVPLVGDLGMFPYLFAAQTHLYREQRRAQYGNIFKTGLFLHTGYVVSDADAAKHILSDSNVFRRTSQSLARFAVGILDNALFIMSTDEVWKKHRKLLQPAFGPSHLRDTAVQSVASSQKLLSSLRKRMDGGAITIDVFETMNKITLDVIGLIAFGVDLDAISMLEHKVEGSIWNDLDRVTIFRIMKRVPIPSFLWTFFGLGTSSPAIVETKAKLYGYMQNLAAEARQKISTLEISESTSQKWNLNVLERLLLAPDLSEEEIFGEMVGFFLAGHETSANMLTFCVFELCNNPDLQDQLYQAVRDITAKELSTIQLSAIPQLENFIKEVQRLHPVVSVVSRKNTVECRVMGHTFPPGTSFSVNIRGIHRNELYYKDPLEFIPDRWNDPTLNPNALVPFSDGPHHCIGKKMALIEIRIILVMLLQSFEFHKLEQTVVSTQRITTSIRGYSASLKLRA